MAEADYTDVSNVSRMAHKILTDIGDNPGSLTALEGRIEGLYRAVDQRRNEGPVLVEDNPIALVSKQHGSAGIYIRIGVLRDDPR